MAITIGAHSNRFIVIVIFIIVIIVLVIIIAIRLLVRIILQNVLLIPEWAGAGCLFVLPLSPTCIAEFIPTPAKQTKDTQSE